MTAHIIPRSQLWVLTELLLNPHKQVACRAPLKEYPSPIPFWSTPHAPLHWDMTPCPHWGLPHPVQNTALTDITSPGLGMCPARRVPLPKLIPGFGTFPHPLLMNLFRYPLNQALLTHPGLCFPFQCNTNEVLSHHQPTAGSRTSHPH